MKTAIDSFRINTTTGPAPSGFAVRARMRAKRLLKANGHVAGLVRVMGGEKSRNPDDVYLRENIRLAQQGDAAAFEFIYRLHCRRVYCLCLRMVKDPTEAEDLAQDLYLPWGIRLFILVASADCQHCSDAFTQEEAELNFARPSFCWR
jgi:hypothetical protein